MVAFSRWSVRLACFVLVLSGCATPNRAIPRSTVRTWGTLREALCDGRTESRVDVAAVLSPQLLAVGAVAGLDGEITIVDGVCHVSRVRAGSIVTEQNPAVGATILFAAEVPRWVELRVREDVPAAELAAFLARAAREAGLDTAQPFPFVIDGELLALEAHVLAGECPQRARMLGAAMTTPPVERRFDRGRGRLVGIYAEHGAGVITHHGSTIHVHVIAGGDAAFTGHCDAVGVAAGAMLRLPDR